MLATAVGVSVLVSTMGIEEANRWSVLFHFSYFAAGALFPEIVRRLAELRLPVLGTGVVFAVATVVVMNAGLWRSVDTLALSLVGVPWGIAVAVRLGDVPRAVPCVGVAGAPHAAGLRPAHAADRRPGPHVDLARVGA